MIEENVLKIRQRICSLCSKINRDPDSITIVAVSKGRSKEQIGECVAIGITEIGENRVQEAIAKYKALTAQGSQIRTIKWHMVGHLQTNKARNAVEIFDLIQSVDSMHLALEIDRQAAKIDKVQSILVQVNTSGEPTKFGLKPSDTIEVIKQMARLKNIDITGLMTIAPIGGQPEKVRSYFRILRLLLDKINDLGLTSQKLKVLSMGMTDDFQIAIEEGSNMVRLGRAIFEG